MSTTAYPPLAFLGTGSMAGAILHGFLRSGTPRTEIRATTRSVARADDLRTQLTAADSQAMSDSDPRARTTTPTPTVTPTETHPDANRAAAAASRVIVLGVKPAAAPALLTEIADVLHPGTVLISIAAGIPTARLEVCVPVSVTVIRAMPNTPALIGRAVTGIAPGSRTTAADLALADILFAAVGDTLTVPEANLDALSTISGSGPAFVFYFIEQLTAAAIAKGFTPEQATLLVQGTFRGAAELAATSPDAPETLRRRVTSPNGTTERAIAVFEAAHLGDLFDRATTAALARARELAADA